jgi:large subunit ribosomal protein L19
MKQQVRDFEAPSLKKDIPDFRPGDTVRVAVRISEGDKERIQNFEGVCIRRKGGGIRETFTVRRVSYGVGMERIFPLHSPKIESIAVVRRGRVRRAKLYYQRDLRGKKSRIMEKKEEIIEAATGGHLREVSGQASEENDNKKESEQEATS